MDYESSDSRTKGCWDPVTLLTPFLEKWSSATPTPEFVVDDVWCGMVGGIGFGKGATEETVGYWKDVLKEVYKGDEGRKKVRMALMCLLTRDGLVLRLGDVQCPVYWFQVSLFPRHIGEVVAMVRFGSVWLGVGLIRTTVLRARKIPLSRRRWQASRSRSSPGPRRRNWCLCRKERII